MLAGTLAQDLDFPALRFRIARIHAEQIAGEDRRLVAAGAGAHLEEDVAVVVRILRNEQALQLEFFGGDARRQLRQLFLHCELARDGGICFEGDETAVALDQRPQSRIFHRQFAKLVLAPMVPGIREQAADFFESLVEFLELAPDRVFHGREL